MLQTINPIFIILLAPVIGMAWVWLGKRNPSIPVKFGIGLVLLGVGFLVLSWGSTYVEAGAKVGMRWLIVTYFLHTVGELCLSPVGLSSITKLSPDRLVGQMMGTWFMGAALGNLIAGLVAGYIESHAAAAALRHRGDDRDRERARVPGPGQAVQPAGGRRQVGERRARPIPSAAPGFWRRPGRRPSSRRAWRVAGEMRGATAPGSPPGRSYQKILR